MRLYRQFLINHQYNKNGYLIIKSVWIFILICFIFVLCSAGTSQRIGTHTHKWVGGARRLLLHDGIAHYFSSVPEWWGRRGGMTVYGNIIQGEKKKWWWIKINTNERNKSGRIRTSFHHNLLNKERESVTQDKIFFTNNAYFDFGASINQQLTLVWLLEKNKLTSDKQTTRNWWCNFQARS